MPAQDVVYARFDLVRKWGRKIKKKKKLKDRIYTHGKKPNNIVIINFGVYFCATWTSMFNLCDFTKAFDL